jgi:quercetin dioxygenase-like cupin family protein
MKAELLALVGAIEARQPLASDRAIEDFGAVPMRSHRELYRNRNAKLGIDFTVDVLDFPGTQAFDVRVVRIAAGCNNELHKHAHESLFYVISGEGEVRIADATLPVSQGEVAFVPRWAFHQSRNLSNTEELVILAVTDFGLTKAVLGDYDKRTRLAVQGADVQEHG